MFFKYLAMKSTLFLSWCLLSLVSGDSYDELRSYVEPIEGDLPSPCNFGKSTQNPKNNGPIGGEPLNSMDHPSLPRPYPQNNMYQYDQNSFAQNFENPSMYNDGMYPPPQFDNANNPFMPPNPPFPCPHTPQEEDNNYIYTDENQNFDYPDYELECDLNTCILKCREFMKKDTAVGICRDNACYCKDYDEEEVDENVSIDPIAPTKIWTYDTQKEWSDAFPMCKGTPQSPININSKDISDLKKKMLFKNFDIPVSFIAINTGNGVRLLLQSSKHLTLTLDSLKNSQKSKNYSLSHIDLHWPYEEHSINNIKSGVMEMQLYFFDSDRFCHYEDASESKSNGPIPSILAVSLIFKLHNEKTDIDNRLFKAMTDLSSKDKVGVSVESKSYLQFIQHKMNYKFGTYKGTLTQPPCSKDLFWFVNQLSSGDNYYISTDQLHILQNIRNLEGERIISNVRSVQK